MSTNYEKVLNAEQWQQVLMNVPPVHLCNVVRTSRYMNSMASSPDLWAGMKINVEKVRVDGLAELYTINRFTKVRKIDFRGKVFTSGELERVLSEIPGSPLEKINLSNVNLSEVPAELMAYSVSHLKIVNLHNTELTTNQCVKVLEASLSSTTLVILKLEFVNLSEVPVKLLARAVSRLETAMLLNTKLTTDQCVNMLEAILSSTTLVNIDLTEVNLSKVPAELLARAVLHLQTVNLCCTQLTTNQCVKVLEASLSSITLANLNLDFVKLSEVSAELLANSVSQLQTVNVNDTHLTTDQCVKMWEAILSSTTLVNVEIRGVNLCEVPAELLARAISHLQTVNLCDTKLTTNQCVKVLEASLSSTTLVKLYLKKVKLSEVPAELLATAVFHLKKVDLLCAELTTGQCVKILEASLSSSTLFNVVLGSDSLREVPAELLARAVKYQGVIVYDIDLFPYFLSQI